MFTEQQNAIEADMAPFGFIDNGLNDPEVEIIIILMTQERFGDPVSYRKGE